MYFALVYEMNNREFNNLVLLSRELIRRGHEVDIFGKSETFVFKHKDGVILLPNSYNKFDIDRYRYIVNGKNNVIVNYPCEQLINRKLPVSYDMSDSNPVKHIHTLCWGEDYYEFITSIGTEKRKCFITGAIQMDFCRTEFKSLLYDREYLADEFKISKEKKWILFISDLVYTETKVVELLKHAGITSSDDLDRRHEFEVSVQKKIIEWFERFLKAHPDYYVIYRKHPNEVITDDVFNLEKKLGGRFRAIDKYNIRNWIIACDSILNYNSTAGAECIVAHKDNAILRPIEFRPEGPSKELDMNKSLLKLVSYDDMESYLLAGRRTVEDHASIRFYHDIIDRPAFMRVADALEDIGRNAVNTLEIPRPWFFKRLKFLIAENTLAKILIKKAYQKLYLTFGFKDNNSVGVGEWQKSAVNRKGQKELSDKIDRILEEYYSW